MSNPFANWTAEDAARHNERVAKKRKFTSKEVSDFRDFLREKPTLAIKTIPKKKTPLLNKTETRFKAELERRGHKLILCQAITFRLGNRMTYRPDFVTVEYGEYMLCGQFAAILTCYETKSPHRFAEKGVQKLKMAATLYPWICFKLIMRNGNEWTERTIGQ